MTRATMRTAVSTRRETLLLRWFAGALPHLEDRAAVVACFSRGLTRREQVQQARQAAQCWTGDNLPWGRVRTGLRQEQALLAAWLPSRSRLRWRWLLTAGRYALERLVLALLTLIAAVLILLIVSGSARLPPTGCRTTSRLS